MKNLYMSSSLLTKDEFIKIQSIFEKVWGKDTAFFEVQDDWSNENKALGQCAVTSLMVFDLLGGKIIYDKPSFHLWNELPEGSRQDFSRIKFNDDRNFSVTKYQTKEEIITGETAIKNKTLQKYLLLKKRFEEFYPG